MRKDKRMATLAVLCALLALAAAIRWWSLGSQGGGIYERHPDTGTDVAVMSVSKDCFFGGKRQSVAVTVTSAQGDVLARAMLVLPMSTRVLPLRSDGKISWPEDGVVEVACPSDDFASGQFKMQIRIPVAPRQ
jgi:hypothetical protein